MHEYEFQEVKNNYTLLPPLLLPPPLLLLLLLIRTCVYTTPSSLPRARALGFGVCSRAHTRMWCHTAGSRH